MSDPKIYVAFLGSIERSQLELYAVGDSPRSVSHDDIHVKGIMALYQDAAFSVRYKRGEISGELRWFCREEIYGVIEYPFNDIKGLLTPCKFSDIPLVCLENSSAGEFSCLVEHSRACPDKLLEWLRTKFAKIKSEPLRIEDVREQHKKGYRILSGAKI